MKPRICVYPGTFNPWHKGHEDILFKALKIFDKVIIAKGYNPDKGEAGRFTEKLERRLKLKCPGGINFISFPGFLKDLVDDIEVDAVIRGLRNSYDLQYEADMQYCNEDLGLKVPTVYFICARDLSHISSSACRQFESIKERDHERAKKENSC